MDWFEARRWPEGSHCPHCGSTEAVEAPNRASARTVPSTQAATLQGFVKGHAAPGANVYTDHATA